MTNKLLSPTKMMAGLAILAGILGTTKESLAQNLASNGKNKAQTENTNGVASNANSLAYTDPLDFTQQNIQNYFPDQESINQANFLINRLGKGTIRNQVNQLIIENIVNNISDPKQQIWTIIYAIEKYVFLGDREVKPIFSNKNDVEDTNNFRSSRRFGRAFTNRLNTNIEQMIKDIEQGRRDIEQGRRDIEQGRRDIEQGRRDIEQGRRDIEQGRERLEKDRIETENMMRFITPEMVKSDPNIKKIVENRQLRYKLGNETPTNPHIISLFDALK